MAAPFQLTPGVVFGGDFRIQELLSAGGMGAVYIATQLSTNKRRALKVMHPQLVADPRQRERFEQEARVGALIESSHVVEVIAAGVEGDSGAPWIAMELLDGQDLGAYAATHGCLSADELLLVLREMCHALGAAHAAGVVHRDIKPENVFLARSQTASAGTSIKVLDFGIAKVAAQAKTTATATVGSPAWMAPEQTDPRAPITPATDVWAIGLMAFWLLTGRAFWLSVNDAHASMHALMREILFSDIPSASERAEELIVAERLFEGFDAWFARCVDRKPERRYQSASDALHAFERILAGEHIVVHTSGPPPSSSPLSLAHSATLSMDSSSDLSTDAPASRTEPMSGLMQRPAPTRRGSRSRKTPTQPMVPPDHVSRTAAPIVSDSGESEHDIGPRSRLASRRSIGMGVAGLVAGGLAVVAVSALGPQRDPAATFIERSPQYNILPKRDPAPPIDPSAAPTSSPPPASANPSGQPSASAAPKRPPAPSAPPFNQVAAEQAMRTSAQMAQHCMSTDPTDVIVSVTVSWKNDGTVAHVNASSDAFATSRFCVESYFHGVTIPAFSGPSMTLGQAVLVKTPH